MSFEDFARSGFSGVDSQVTDGHREIRAMGPVGSPIDTGNDGKQTRVAADSKVSSPQSASTGLGLNMFAGFNFGPSATLIPIDAAAYDVTSDRDTAQVAGQGMLQVLAQACSKRRGKRKPTTLTAATTSTTTATTASAATSTPATTTASKQQTKAQASSSTT